MSKSTEEYLQHILDEIAFLEGQRAKLNTEVFLQDPVQQRAFARSMEIIGEAVKQIPEDIKKQYPLVDWKGLAGLRDKLIHHYFGVDYSLVWDVVVSELPHAKVQIPLIISSLSRNKTK